MRGGVSEVRGGVRDMRGGVSEVRGGGIHAAKWKNTTFNLGTSMAI